MIIKQSWFFALEISEMHQQINRETHQLGPNTITNTEKQESSNQIRMPSNSNRNTTHANIRRKKECRDFEKNYVWKVDHIIISQEPRLEKSREKWKE